jgi:putative glutathione S-transferase
MTIMGTNKRESEQTSDQALKKEKMVARLSWEDELKSGDFKRSKSAFQSVISPVSEEYKPGKDRYHLYLAKACPWANRLEILVRLLGMTEYFPITFVDPVFAEIGDGRTGWVFTEDFPDTLNGKDSLYEVYLKYHPDYEGKATTPMLLDKKTGTIVSNESRDMLKSLCWGCKDLHKEGTPDYYPREKEALIDEWTDKMYDPLLNGVYKCGFTTDQDVYDKQIESMFSLLDEVDERLGKNKWMLGDEFSVLDLVIGVTLCRFDAVYYVHFMCCKQHIYDYEHLSNYARSFYQLEHVKAATDLEKCKMHYFKSHHVIAPMTLIAASNKNADLSLPHNRDELFPSSSSK